jgi:hypothetical protein
MERTPEQVRALREQAAKQATVCGDCFAPLAAGASVTVVSRPIRIPAATDWRGRPVPEHDDWIAVPVCLLCWLDGLQRGAEPWVRDLRHDQHEAELIHVARLERFRCQGCDRPVRVQRPLSYRSLFLSERVCCTDCERSMRNARNRHRRRVRHQKRTCAACGERFVPKRTDAVTCSNACRQKMHRQRSGGRGRGLMQIS